MKTTIEIEGTTYEVELGVDGDTPDVIVLQGMLPANWPAPARGGDAAALGGLEWAEGLQLKSWRVATSEEIRKADRIAYARPVSATATGTSLEEQKRIAASVSLRLGREAEQRRAETAERNAIALRGIASAVAALPTGNRPEVSLGCWLSESEPGAREAITLLRAHGAKVSATAYANHDGTARVIVVAEATISGVTFRAQVTRAVTAEEAQAARDGRPSATASGGPR